MPNKEQILKTLREHQKKLEEKKEEMKSVEMKLVELQKNATLLTEKFRKFIVDLKDYSSKEFIENSRTLTENNELLSETEDIKHLLQKEIKKTELKIKRCEDLLKQRAEEEDGDGEIVTPSLQY